MWYVWFGLFLVVGFLYAMFSLSQILTILFFAIPFATKAVRGRWISRRIYVSLFRVFSLHAILGAVILGVINIYALPPMRIGFIVGVIICVLISIKGRTYVANRENICDFAEVYGRLMDPCCANFIYDSITEVTTKELFGKKQRHYKYYPYYDENGLIVIPERPEKDKNKKQEPE